jgi:hypothetical protein
LTFLGATTSSCSTPSTKNENILNGNIKCKYKCLVNIVYGRFVVVVLFVVNNK